MRKDRGTTLLKRYKRGRAPTFGVATRKFHSEWSSYINLAPGESSLISAPGLSISEPNARMPVTDSMLGPFFAMSVRAYPLLRADLETLLPDKSTPVVLMKVNVCRLLEPRLTADGFDVINKGVAIYFPSTGGQTKFHQQCAEILTVTLADLDFHYLPVVFVLLNCRGGDWIFFAGFGEEKNPHWGARFLLGFSSAHCLWDRVT